MKYQSQKIAMAYFATAMGVFAIQVLGRLFSGFIYITPNFLSELLPFNIVRMLHTNALVVWLLLGFFWRGLLSDPGKIRTRNPFTHNCLSAIADFGGWHPWRGSHLCI